MATVTISPTFQIVVPKECARSFTESSAALTGARNGGVITLVLEVPLKNLKGALKGLSKTDIREKKDRRRRS
jgi:hypothetical protein